MKIGFLEDMLGAVTKSMGSGGGNQKFDATITTQVSPQISPVFQQQFQPSNSALTAGTQMIGAAAGSGSSPVLPGIDTSSPIPDSISPIYSPDQNAVSENVKKMLPWIIGGIGLMLIVKMIRNNKAQ